MITKSDIKEANKLLLIHNDDDKRLLLGMQWEGRVYIYRIAGNFRGVQFLWFSWISGYPRKLEPRSKYDCTVYNWHDPMRPRKLWRLGIRENWTPRKYPAIWYTALCLQMLFRGITYIFLTTSNPYKCPEFHQQILREENRLDVEHLDTLVSLYFRSSLAPSTQRSHESGTFNSVWTLASPLFLSQKITYVILSHTCI
jgi:hypothetical protein